MTTFPLPELALSPSKESVDWEAEENGFVEWNNTQAHPVQSTLLGFPMKLPLKLKCFVEPPAKYSRLISRWMKLWEFRKS